MHGNMNIECPNFLLAPCSVVHLDCDLYIRYPLCLPRILIQNTNTKTNTNTNVSAR
jgi:hypothetical protein